jgi:hypothetical protein
MKRRGSPTLLLIAVLPACAALMILLAASAAHADEDDDLQRQIESQKSGVQDLEHLDLQKAASGDIQRLRDWLALAWDLRNKHEPDDAREVLDRCIAQAELVRQIIATSSVKAEVAEKEAKLQRTRAETERKKKALQDAQVKKRALEPAVGS